MQYVVPVSRSFNKHLFFLSESFYIYIYIYTKITLLSDPKKAEKYLHLTAVKMFPVICKTQFAIYDFSHLPKNVFCSHSSFKRNFIHLYINIGFNSHNSSYLFAFQH